MAATLR